MELASILVFATALFFAAATPGPGIAAIIARVLGRGPKGAVAFTVGVALGDIVWFSAAVAGLAVLAQTFHWLFLVVKWAGVAYLLFLAWKMWRTPVRPSVGEGAPAGRRAPIASGGQARTPLALRHGLRRRPGRPSTGRSPYRAGAAPGIIAA